MFEEYLSLFRKIDECCKPGARVLLRVDINSPLNPSTREIIDDYRLKAHAETIKYLMEEKVKVVILSHQSRPGRDDFTSLDRHRSILEKYVGHEIKFVDDVMGPAARRMIRELEAGEALLLDNVRFVSEEIIERKIEAQAETYLVRRLAPLFDYYVFDAFATAHRSQPSIVGFPLLLPSCIGLVMERELKALSRIQELKGKGVMLAVGGVKVHETIRAVDEVLRRNIVDKVMVGGIVGVVFMVARYGFATQALKKVIEEHGLMSYISYVAEMINSWGDRIIIPIDVAIDINGSRIDVDIYSISSDIMDVGLTSMRKFSNTIKSSKAVIVCGPLGYVEDEKYAMGTRSIIEESLKLGKYVIISGGHTIMIARRTGLADRVHHISTGGRAFLSALSRSKLPALEALEISTRKFWVRK